VHLVIGKPGNWIIAAGAIAVLAVTLAAGQRPPQILRSQLVWVDRAGRKLSTVTELADFGNIELSPDRRQIAAAVLNDQTGKRELWLYDAVDGRKRRVDDNVADENWMIWSPDGKRIAYNSQRTKGLDLYGRDLGGNPRETLLAIDEGRGQWPVSWSPDGKYMLVVTNVPDKDDPRQPNNDIWVLPLGNKEKPYPFLNSDASENWAAFSPNGKWVAFSFAGRNEETELYVTTFPKPGRRYLVSARGGFQARWRRDGKELFFLATNGTLTTSLMAAEVDGDGKDFEVKDVTKLFDTPVPYPPYHAFDLSADGQRILINSLLIGPSSRRSAQR
jgi:Tol biopolymer transport system component